MRSYLRWGRGSPKPRGQWARRLGSQYPGNPGLRRNRGRQGPAVPGGQGGAGSWVAQSFRICPILCSQPRGGQSLCEGLNACSHAQATLKVEVCRPPVFPCSGVQGPLHSAPAGPPPATSCALGLLFSSPPGSYAGPSSLKTVLAQVCRSPAGFTGYLFCFQFKA